MNNYQIEENDIVDVYFPANTCYNLFDYKVIHVPVCPEDSWHLITTTPNLEPALVYVQSYMAMYLKKKGSI